MEAALKKCNELYDELIKEKKLTTKVRFEQAEQSSKLNDLDATLKKVDVALKVKYDRLKVYEDVETCEKANKVEARRLSDESDRLAGESKVLRESRVSFQQEVTKKNIEIKVAREGYEVDVKAIKKTQAELKEKQAKVDKFLSQVK